MRLVSFIVLGLLVAGCGGAEPAVTSEVVSLRGVDTMGRELFEERVVGANPGCINCHSLDEGVTVVGPSLFAVASKVPGLSDADYIRESILDPDGHIVEGFTAGQMNGGWEEYLTEEQVDSLVEFLSR